MEMGLRVAACTGGVLLNSLLDRTCTKHKCTCETLPLTKKGKTYVQFLNENTYSRFCCITNIAHTSMFASKCWFSFIAQLYVRVL
jgi:hypothetical protein